MKKTYLLLLLLGFALGANARSPKVIYLSNSVKSSTGQYMDSTVLTELVGHGYDVSVTYPTASSFNWARLDSADLVIIGRISASGDFVSTNWAAVKAPVFTFSSWVIRNNRLKFINSGTTNRLTTKTSTVSKDTIIKANVSFPTDPIFEGVNVASGQIDFMKWFFDYIDVDSTAFANGNNGKLLATAYGPGRVFENRVLAARWSPEIETYSGSGNFPANFRSFIQMGADDGALPPVRNFVQYTPESYQMIFNELAYLTSVDIRQKVKFSNVGATGFDVSWSNDAAASKAVFISASTTGNPELINNTTYTANSAFGSGDLAGTGWYCVYNGTGTSVAVTGLTKNTEYRVMVVEYLGSAASEDYQVVYAPLNPGNQFSADDNSNALITANNRTKIVVYSNSAQDVLTVSNAASSLVEIVTIQGKLLKTIKVSGDNKQINISTLASGMYLLRVDGQVLKFLKK